MNQIIITIQIFRPENPELFGGLLALIIGVIVVLIFFPFRKKGRIEENLSDKLFDDIIESKDKRKRKAEESQKQIAEQHRLMMNPQMKEWIKCLPDREFGGYVHHGLGRYLRNNWGLWGRSKLAENLSQMGVFHPDDMSGIILDSYQRKLKGEAIKLEEQIKFVTLLLIVQN